MPYVDVNAGSAPIYRESMEAGHARYAAALQDIADRHCPYNIIATVVSKGDHTIACAALGQGLHPNASLASESCAAF